VDLLPLDHKYQARQRFARQLGAAPDGFDLVEACLWVAAEEYPDLSVENELQRVRLIAGEGARRVYDLANPFARLDGLRTYFFDELGFRGNADDYNAPDNCHLNQVLDRRLGIPLSLSILFMEVANAAGFESRGVSLPGHFIVRVEWMERTLLVDVYNRGEVISEEDCRQLVSRTTGRPSLFRRSVLNGTDERLMLRRLLMNLKHVYVESEDYPRALSSVERLLMLTPDDPAEIRDRGFLQAHMGRAGAAIVDLESYLRCYPDAPDTESVRGRVAWLRRRLSESN